MLLTDYKKLLASHDWFYQHSDDGRVYRSGRADFETLCRQQGILDLDATIWNEYCPSDFTLYKNNQ